MKLAIATNNAHKLSEIKAILGNSFDELLSLKELGIDIDVEETGTTLEENSYLKARTICDVCNMPTLADDTGLMVDALNGAPESSVASHKPRRRGKQTRAFFNRNHHLLSERRVYHRKRSR